MDAREARILVATALVAVGAPLGASAWVSARTDQLAAHLGEAGGVPARIGGVDADLTGAIRITDVALGELFAADAIEASVAMGSLLDGQLRADELRVAAPHVAIELDADGDSDLARLLRRMVQRGRPTGAGAGGGGAAGVRRVVVTEGSLTARVAGLGELRAEAVELVPDAGGVRVVTGPVHVRGARGAAAIDARFERAAAELALPHLRFGRVLAIGGAGRVALGGEPLALRQLSVGRLSAGGALEVRASADDGGVPRPLALDVAPGARTVAIRGERVPLRVAAALAPRGLELAEARASGALIVRRGARGLELSADGALDGLVVDHAAFAPHPVALDAALTADVSIAPEVIAVPRATITSGAARVAASGWLRRGAPGLAARADVELAPAPCAALLAAIPAALRGPLDDMLLAGTAGAHGRLAIDLGAPDGEGVTLDGAIAGGCRVDHEPPGADVAALAAPGDQQLADGTRARVGRGEPDYTALRGLPAHVTGAFVSAEDARFWTHGGFDLVQIARSLEIDLREGRLARGGSTISQQLVKNAFLSQRRSLDRKLHEAVLAWRLEARLDKKQILERYLNIIELGPRVFGVTAAARHWFGAAPRDLTVRQAAFLAAMTSQPASMSRRVRRAGGLDPDSAERVAVILRAMRRDGVITGDAYQAARHAPLGFAATALAD